MIASIFHEGSGLGNQLHSYVMARILAKEKGLDFGIIYPENFKGRDFMKLDMGVEVKGLLHKYDENKRINKDGNDIRDYDIYLRHVSDFTLVDGYFQSEKYFGKYLEEVKEWLRVEPLDLPEDLCVINFRGGEYVGVKDLFLPQSYWDEAIILMQGVNPYMRFEVHTDDPETAKQFFPVFPIIHDIGLNWRSIRYAKHLILSNSSFAILPALLGEAEEIIAPEFWAGYNKGYWQLRQNNYKRFTYI